MSLVWLTVYVLTGCCIAFYIHKDGEFRPVETQGYVIAAVFVWPFALPIWLMIRPPSMIKDLTFENSPAHFKHWQKTHKTRDLGDFSYMDKKKCEDDEFAYLDMDDDISGKTSPSNPYVIGSGKSNNHFEKIRHRDEDYSPDSIEGMNGNGHSNGHSPRKSYNPFKEDCQPTYRSAEPETNSIEIKPQKESKKKTEIPSIADILDDSHLKQKKPAQTSGVFADHNVRKMIDNGRLRDAFRVCRRMLKVASELGEEDRSAAYQRYIREIENRLQAEKKKLDN